MVDGFQPTQGDVEHELYKVTAMKFLADALVIAITYISTCEDDSYAQFTAFESIFDHLADSTYAEQAAVIESAKRTLAAGDSTAMPDGNSPQVIETWLTELFGEDWRSNEPAVSSFR